MRYLVFACDDYQEFGGMGDLHGAYNELPDPRQFLRGHSVHALDLTQLRVTHEVRNRKWRKALGWELANEKLAKPCD